MGLYGQISLDEYNKINARNQRNAAEKAAQQLAQRQAAQQAANNKKSGGLIDTLVGIAKGVGEKIGDAGATLGNIGKTIAGGINQIGANKSVENIQKEDSQRRNEIAKKYGFNSYTEAINSDKVGDDFWNEIKGSNKQTQEKQKANTEAYRNNLSDVTKIDLNKAKGQALNTIDTVGMALPGGAGVAANIIGGGLAGMGDEYKAAAAEGREYNAENARKNALAGMAGGAAGSAAGGLLNKAAAKTSGNALGKLLGSNVGKGIGSGAAAGAAAGATATLANGGSIEDALRNAAEGAKGGALGGGVMAGTMGLAGRGLQALQNRRNGINTSEPVDAQIVQKNRIEAPTTRAIEAETPSTRRGIAIKDLNAGVEDVPVRVVNGVEPVQSRGRYIDGVVAGKNLPEATAQDYGNAFARYTGVPEFGEETLVRAMGNPDTYFSGDEGYATLLDATPKNLQETLRQAARDGESMQNPYAQYEQYGIRNQNSLPTLNRDEYYYDVTGNLKRNGGVLSAEDIPDYMQPHLRQDSSIRNDVILNELFGDNMDLRDQYALYDEIAQVRNNNPTYTTDNAAMGLALDQNAANEIMRGILNEGKQGITVQGGPATPTEVPVTNRAARVAEPNYTESTIPARNYEQAIQNMPEAEIAPRVENGTATGWGDKEMTNAAKKRNLLQKAGDTLQETGKATKDSQVYSKLKGNTAEEMARKNSVERLRELGFKSSDYDKAANLSEVANKYYDDAIKQTKTPIEAPQLRNIAREVADDLHISSANRADLEKILGTMLDDAVAKDGKMTGLTMDRFTPSDLEKVAKQLGQKAENITTTNYGGRKKAIRNLTPDNEEYARALAEARNRIRNEIVEMTDYNPKELEARLKDAGATQKQIDYVMQDGTLRGVKSRTSLFEDARTMNQQIKSDALKRGANATNSTNFGTQVANASGLSSLVNTVAKPVAGIIGGIEKGVGKALTGIGNAVSGDSESLGNIGKGAANIASKAGEKLNNATAALNDKTAANIAIGGTTLGNIAQQVANRTIASDQAEFANNRAEQAQAAQAVEEATNNYNTALANAQNAMNAVTQGQNNSTAQLDRIARAMDLAMQAGDMTAYGQLVDLYKQAYSIYELQNPQTKQETKALSANQSKALTGLQQLEALKGMKSGVRTALSDSILGGLVDLTGGDEYANQAKSLALTLGYLQSGANITPREAESIGKAYVPTAFDSEEVKQGKLARAEQLLRDYLADTTALQQ